MRLEMALKPSAASNFRLNFKLIRWHWNFPINTQLEPLLAQITNHHEPSLKRLYQLTNANLFALALRILKQRDLAEDCLQLAFVKVWNNSQQFNPAKAKAITWLNAIVRNQALDLLRKNKHQQLHDTSDETIAQLADQSASQEKQASLSQEQQAIQQCLAQLKENQRQCLQLAYFEGLAHPQISAHLNQPLGSVKTWIRRGLLGLRECLTHII
jgi:RNA polymerase sigma-70 factor (ECF subfamily)